MATRYRFRVEEFERAFRDVPRVELLRGEVYQMSPIGPKHFLAAMRLDHMLKEALQGKALVAVQSPLHLSEDSEPEPDLLVLQPPLERYEGRLPRPEDVLLLVEVADISLEFDREVKLPLYAEASVHVKTWDHPFRMDLRPRGWAGTHRRWSPWNSLPHSSTP